MVESIGQRLTMAMKGRTLSWLARASGLQRWTLWRIRVGKVKPDLDTAERLARACDVKAGWLAFGEGEP